MDDTTVQTPRQPHEEPILSDTERALTQRVEILEEDLDHEAGLTVRTERLRVSLRRLRKDYRDLDRLTTTLLRAAVAGWTAVIGLAVVLIEVIG